MTREALVVAFALALPACGNMARDVIVERAVPDAGAVIDDDAGVWPVTVEDASPPSGSNSPPACERDGGCGSVHHCDPNECSPVCSLGCHRDHKRMMSWHAGYP